VDVMNGTQDNAKTKGETMKATKTIIANYVDLDGLAILFRQNGGSAWVEVLDGRSFLVVNRSISWCRKVTRKANWVTPSEAVFSGKVGA